MPLGFQRNSAIRTLLNVAFVDYIPIVTTHPQTGVALNMAIFHRKPNRLPLESYRGPNVYSVTVRCVAPAPFRDSALVSDCVQELSDSAARHCFEVLAYCFMPDHLHLLLQGGVESYLPDFMRHFKQITAFRFREVHHLSLWQKSYYDHIVRREEDIQVIARYIAANPVRAGLVDDAKDYPHGGSSVWGPAFVEA